MGDTEECTGAAAQWCPNCGTCTCHRNECGRREYRATCPLHGVESRHAETLCAGDCREIVSAPGVRCDPCEVKHLRAELDALRVIIEGRTVPPTDAEIEAHARADAGGLWRWVARVDGEVIAGCSRDREEWCSTEPLAGLPRRIGAVYTVRWWALDSTGRPCAWPVVTEAPSR